MKGFLLIFSFILLIPISLSQGVISSEDLENFDAAELSEVQLFQIQTELESMNTTLESSRALIIEKGMPLAQFNLLSERLSKLKKQHNKPEISEQKIEFEHPPLSVASDFEKKDGWVFGSEIFSNKSLSFEPNQSLSTPDAYVLGAGDELQVVIYGIQQFTETVRVSKNGTIFLSNIGSVNVGGLQLGAAVQLINKKAASIYQTLNNGRSDLSVTISEFKTIQVTMIGVEQPGNYTLSSLASVFNGLHMAGGPSENGSYRNIELIRNNKIFKKIDLYDFLTAGDLSSNLSLQNNDIIRVPTYTTRVEVTGEVKRPGLFELKEGENFERLLLYCSGFTENAYTKNIQLTTATDAEYKIETIPKSAFKTIVFKSGDKLKIGKLLSSFENMVSISGAVYRPFEYELVDGMRISDLLNKADGLTDDAFAERALILRRDEKLQAEIIGVNLLDIIANPDSDENILLVKNDELIVSSISELKEDQNIVIAGEVSNPGEFAYAKNLTLYDLIIMAGGFKTSASNKVEIGRISDSTTKETKIITLEIDPLLESNTQNFKLEPNDIVSVRRLLNYNLAEGISLVGEINYPGIYAIRSDNERIGDLIARSGGLNERANPNGIKIIRKLNINSSTTEDDNVVIIPIDYESILKNPNSKANILIQKGDEIRVERLVETTAVSGAVAMETEIPVKNNKSAKYYIKSSGGFSDNANKKKTYVIYSNGVAKTTKNFGLFEIYPNPEFGSTIVVPEKSEKPDGLSTQEIVTLSAILSSATGITVALISLVTP